MKWSSWRVVELFCEAVPYRPTTQNAKRRKAREGSCQYDFILVFDRERAGGIGSTWVPLERVNPSPSPTHSARESELAKAEAVLKGETWCSRETKSIWGHLNTLVELELAFEASIVSMRFFDVGFKYLEFEVKHGHYLARRNKAAEKNEEIKAWRSPSPIGESPIGLEIAFCSSVLCSEIKGHIGDEME
ncbi:hypothetical protein H5410_051106 [Solanum commersonii]|uniref:Uncharacterized protein n=1 Tax=Solanum commersonii TaxID=4109 RepID=A0A9J5WYM7_SOLCO|nr:hypothetical protein H5410_051106 [Solanum commersonii]